MLALYRDYFRHLVSVHPDLESEKGEVFQLIDWEKAYGDFRSQVVIKGFIFRLMTYTFQLDDQDWERMNFRGGFIIAKYNNSRQHGTDEFFAAMLEAERLTKEFAKKMVTDSQNLHPLFDQSANTLEQLNWNSIPMLRAGDGSYAGWLSTFSIRPQLLLDFCHLDSVKYAEWIEPTPHTL